MDTRLPYWGSIIFSTIALILLVVNVSMASSNRAMQTNIQQRQADIASAQPLNQLAQGLVQAMAEAVTKNGDNDMRDLLASQGITVKTDAAAPAAAPAAKTDKK